MKMIAPLFLLLLLLGGCGTTSQDQYAVIAGQIAATTYVTRGETPEAIQERAREVVRTAAELKGIYQESPSADMVAMTNEYFDLALGDRVLLASVFAVTLEYVRSSPVLTSADVVFLTVLLENIAAAAKDAAEAASQ